MTSTQQADHGFASMFKVARRMARKYGNIGIYEPDDVAHGALIKLLNRRDEKAATIGWLYKTVRSAAADLARNCARERAFVSLDIDGSPGGVCERADELGNVYLNGRHGTLEQDDREVDLIPQLTGMLKQLADPLREVLILYASGMSYDEIAAATGAKLGTVRSRLHYARIRAKAILGDVA